MHSIKVVEKVDDGAFHRKHMFQVVIVLSGQVINPDTPPEVSLYLQAAVSHYYMHVQWVSMTSTCSYESLLHACAVSQYDEYM